jgi:hypothetical protein
MKEPGELEKLNAVAQAEASVIGLRAFRVTFLILSVVALVFAVVVRATPSENASVRTFAALTVVATICLHAGLRYALPVARLFLPLGFAALVLSTLRLTSWEGAISLTAAAYLLMFEGSRAFRLARAIHLTNSSGCTNERERVGRWISDMRSASLPPGLIQFAAGDIKIEARVIIRVLHQDHWLVVASFHNKKLVKMPSLTIFDTHNERISYVAENQRLHIGKREFRKVETTPELTMFVNRLAQENAGI